MNARPYQFIFLGLVDRIVWKRDDVRADRFAKRWAGIFRKRFVAAQPLGSMARAIAEDNDRDGPHVQWRPLAHHARSGTIKYEQRAPWRPVSVGTPA